MGMAEDLAPGTEPIAHRSTRRSISTLTGRRPERHSRRTSAKASSTTARGPMSTSAAPKRADERRRTPASPLCSSPGPTTSRFPTLKSFTRLAIPFRSRACPHGGAMSMLPHSIHCPIQLPPQWILAVGRAGMRTRTRDMGRIRARRMASDPALQALVPSRSRSSRWPLAPLCVQDVTRCLLLEKDLLRVLITAVVND